MVRKTTFSKSDVIAAAVAVIDAEGITQLTARKVADEMGASTAPVYSNFKTMDDLLIETKKSTVEILLSSIEKSEQVSEFHGIGRGVLLFAKNHPHLYDALFLQPANIYDPGPQVMDRILDRMATMSVFQPLQPVERLILLKKMAIFTHGLATEICNGFLDHYQWRELLLLLDEVGEALVNAAFTSAPRTDEDMELLGTFWSKCHRNSKISDCLKPESNAHE